MESDVTSQEGVNGSLRESSFDGSRIGNSPSSAILLASANELQVCDSGKALERSKPYWSIARIAILCETCDGRLNLASISLIASANFPPPGTTVRANLLA